VEIQNLKAEVLTPENHHEAEFCVPLIYAKLKQDGLYYFCRILAYIYTHCHYNFCRYTALILDDELIILNEL
jgi:hypothetical protein